MTFSRRTLFAALAIAAAASFLLCGYEFIRSVSKSLFIDAYGAKNLPWGMSAVFPTMILMLYAYGRLLSWFGANRALLITSLLSAAVIGGGYVLILKGFRHATVLIYVFREAYIVLIIEQYWSLVNSILTPQQARRINGPFCGLASLGSATGAFLVGQLATRLGSETLLLFAAGSLLPAAACSAAAYAFAGEPQASDAEKRGKLGHMGLRVFFRSRYLVFIGLLILTTQVVSTVLDLRFSGLVEIAMPDKDVRSAFFGNFYGTLALVAAALQFIATPLLLRFIPIRLVHLGIPLIHLVACSILAGAPSLRTGAVAFLLFKCLDYSVFRASKEMFYIPLSFDARYRAKQLIDSFGYRSAKSGGGFAIALIGLIATIPGTAFPVTAIIMAVVWSGVVSKLTTQYQELEKSKG
ncbi:MAG: Npt1/Npt2 family nucleotide transporter [Candidatus Poribacteria bacterium]|nr:Npt1/Npt2 family nucleotide transporter [Candidatus Poribacteria bacterium]